MSKNGAIIDWDIVENDIRRVLKITACALKTYDLLTPEMEKQMFKVPLDSEFDIDEDLDKIDLRQFYLYQLVKRAYNYGYQLDGYEEADGTDWQEVGTLLGQALPAELPDGDTSPLYTGHETALATILRVFFARFGMNVYDNSMSVNDLALLANMTVPAVRSSLSKEGFKLERNSSDDEDRATLSPGDALRWLSKRRGYIPNRGRIGDGDRERIVYDLVWSDDVPFDEVLSRIDTFFQIDRHAMANAIGRDVDWLSSLLDGRKCDIDIEALRLLARELNAPEAKFVGRAVTHLLG